MGSEPALERSEGVTLYDCSNGQVQFVQIEPCLNVLSRIAEQPPRADTSAVGAIMQIDF